MVTTNWDKLIFILSSRSAKPSLINYSTPDYNSPLVYWLGYCNLSIKSRCTNVQYQVCSLPASLTYVVNNMVKHWSFHSLFEYKNITGELTETCLKSFINVLCLFGSAFTKSKILVRIVEIHQSLGPLEVPFFGQFSGFSQDTTKINVLKITSFTYKKVANFILPLKMMYGSRVDLSLESKLFRPETHRSKVIYYRGPNFVCFWAAISVQGPAFPGPKSRPRDPAIPKCPWFGQLLHQV